MVTGECSALCRQVAGPPDEAGEGFGAGAVGVMAGAGNGDDVEVRHVQAQVLEHHGRITPSWLRP